MITAGNLLKPSDIKLVIVSTQDNDLGFFYLTLIKDGEKNEGNFSINESKVISAYELGVVGLHGKIKISRNLKIDNEIIIIK
jgi:DNA-directed RNA polymerase subunit beta'